MQTVRADSIDLLRTRTSAKWQSYPDDVLPLFVAEMDYPLAPAIAAALHQLVDRSDTGYVAGPGVLPAAFAGFAERRWGWKVDPSRLRTTTDVSVGIVESLRQVIQSGDGVVITTPVYPPFFDLVPEAGGVVVDVPLVDDGRTWSLDLDAIEAAFADGARALLLCNPHNPLGLVHSREALTALAELAKRYDVTIVSDEIHGPLTHPGVEFTPFLSVSDDAREHGICVTSASKAFNLAGLKCAVMVAASDTMTAMLDAMPVEVGYRTSLFGLHASAAALDHGDEWLDGAIAAIVENRSLLTEHLPGVDYREPSASFLAWLDFRATGWGDDPSERALEQARVALNPGPSFGVQGAGFARLNLACSPEVLTEAVERLASTR
jgi:cystathionine beta-lyase